LSCATIIKVFITVTSVLFSCGQDLPATFREAFSGKHDRLVEKIDSADYSGLLIKLQPKGVITDQHKRHLESE